MAKQNNSRYIWSVVDFFPETTGWREPYDNVLRFARGQWAPSTLCSSHCCCELRQSMSLCETASQHLAYPWLRLVHCWLDRSFRWPLSSTVVSLSAWKNWRLNRISSENILLTAQTPLGVTHLSPLPFPPPPTTHTPPCWLWSNCLGLPQYYEE